MRTVGVSTRTLTRRRQELDMSVSQVGNLSQISDATLDELIRAILT